MSERRFMIKELSDPSKWNLFPVPSITETEFRRRIDLAFRAAFCALDEKFDYAKAVEIILHGEGEKVEESPLRDKCKADDGDSLEFAYARRLAKSIWEKHWKQDAPEWEPYDNLWGVLSQIDNMTCGMVRVKDDQPSPAPTREEWEAWAKNMPSEYVNLWQWRDAMARWFLSMPIVPKE